MCLVEQDMKPPGGRLKSIRPDEPQTMAGFVFHVGTSMMSKFFTQPETLCVGFDRELYE